MTIATISIQYIVYRIWIGHYHIWSRNARSAFLLILVRFKGVAKKFKEFFKKFSREFQESFNGVFGAF